MAVANPPLDRGRDTGCPAVRLHGPARSGIHARCGRGPLPVAGPRLRAPAGPQAFRCRVVTHFGHRSKNARTTERVHDRSGSESRGGSSTGRPGRPMRSVPRRRCAQDRVRTLPAPDAPGYADTGSRAEPATDTWAGPGDGVPPAGPVVSRAAPNRAMAVPGSRAGPAMDTWAGPGDGVPLAGSVVSRAAPNRAMAVPGRRAGRVADRRTV